MTSIEQKYKKVNPREHVLLRPEMYVGSIETHSITQWLFRSKAPKREVVPLMLPPGLEYEKASEAIAEEAAAVEGAAEGAEAGAADEDAAAAAGEEIIGETAGSDDEALDASSDAMSAVKKNDDEERETRSALVPEDADYDTEYTFTPDDTGSVQGIDERLLIAERAEMCFPAGSLQLKTAYVNPGLLKIVDEIIVNAADNRLEKKGRKQQTFIRVWFDPDTGRITCENDGASIPVEKHAEEKLWVPELIFGHLLTSSHYDNVADSIAAGRHGYGAKLTNIFSTDFAVTCVHEGRSFQATWSDNMAQQTKAHITNTKEGDLTRISFVPDYDRFAEKPKPKAENAAEGENDASSTPLPPNLNMREELHAQLLKRCLDLGASIGTDVKVYFNDELMTPRSFGHYAKMHMRASEAALQPYFINAGNGCEYAYALSPYRGDDFRTVHESLVNGIATTSGGTHLRQAQLMLDDAITKVQASMQKKQVSFNAASFRAHCTVLVNVLAPQPKFDSQSKAKLVSRHDFASFNTSVLVRHIRGHQDLSSFCISSVFADSGAINAMLKKADQQPMIKLIPKLVEPADMTTEGVFRTLVLTEGDSAKALALNSLSTEQRRTFGIFPLRGKVLNLRAHTSQRIRANAEVMNLLMALGLRMGTTYQNTNQLRYQRILVMTDQDPDGLHIRGLLINVFQRLWPSLMEHCPGFVQLFNTPLVKARVPGAPEQRFFSTKDFLAWREALEPAKQSKVRARYYKGLGTSTNEEGRGYFKEIDSHSTTIAFNPEEPHEDGQLLDRVFGSQHVQWRRHWLERCSASASDEITEGGIPQSLTLPQFVNKEFIHFANYDNLRMLPSLYDGLKITQRKVIWALLNRPGSATERLRVSQVAGYVSEKAQFHHGEASMTQTIVNLAHDFVGSNNLNWLVPEGQFGTRLMGGSDSAAARYIYTYVNEITRLVFPKEDDAFLTYTMNDGEEVEPRYYVPVIPTFYANTSHGIGVGHASRTLPHLPQTLVAAARAMVNGATAEEAAKELKVGATLFTGTVEGTEEPNKFRCFGNVKMEVPQHPVDISRASIRFRITDIPFRSSIQQYRELLATITSSRQGAFTDFKDFSNGSCIDMEVSVSMAMLIHNTRLTPRSILEFLQLVRPLSMSPTALDSENGIVPLASPVAVLKRHFDARFAMYEKRLETRIASQRAEVAKLNSHIRFAELVHKEGAKLLKLSEPELDAALANAGCTRHEGSFKYLTNRSFVSLLNTNVEGTRTKLAAAEKELKRTLAEDTPRSVWLKDLDKIEECITAMGQERDRQLRLDGGKPRHAEKGCKLLPLQDGMKQIVKALEAVGWSRECGMASMPAPMRARLESRAMTVGKSGLVRGVLRGKGSRRAIADRRQQNKARALEAEKRLREKKSGDGGTGGAGKATGTAGAGAASTKKPSPPGPTRVHAVITTPFLSTVESVNTTFTTLSLLFTDTTNATTTMTTTYAPLYQQLAFQQATAFSSFSYPIIAMMMKARLLRQCQTQPQLTTTLKPSLVESCLSRALRHLPFRI